MDTTDAALEAEVDLDQQAQSQQQQADQGRKRGARAAQAAKGGINTPSESRELEREADEESSLLPPQEERQDDSARKHSWSGGEDFAHLPWYKRPSIFWVLGPFFFVALAFGGSITPKINLILQLVCREYYEERMISDPGFTTIPIDFNGGDNDQCRVPAVQSKVSLFMLWIGLISGLLSALSSPKLGALSDRYGRKKILIITSMGTIAGEIITIIAATRPETISVEWLLLGAAFDGLTGSFIVSMAIVNSYVTDCTPASMRNVAFGYIHGCLFSGIAFGPIIAGFLVRDTGKIVIVFYILLAVHLCFVCFIALIAPESLSRKRQLAARSKHALVTRDLARNSNWDLINQLRSLNLLAPLKVLYPTGPGSSPALRRNLVFLAAVDTIVFGVAMGSMTVIIIYTNYAFGWKTFEASRFLSTVNLCRVFCLIALLPLATRLLRPRPNPRDSGSDLFDLSVIRLAVLFDTAGYLGYSLARTGGAMTLAGAVAAIGGIGSPTLQSALTKHVPAEQTGQLLGATGLLHALARVVAPTVFNAIYAATVGKFSQTVFVCLTATFGVAFLASWVVRPHVYFDQTQDPPSEEAGGSDRDVDADARGSSLPVVGPVMAAGASVLACLGLGRE